MRFLNCKLLFSPLLCACITAWAVPPKQLITHNTTDVEANAYIAGKIPSQHPTKPKSDNKVAWTSVKIACYGHVTNSKCSALIKMGTDTANPVDLGYLQLDLNTGELTPTQISGNGYALIVNGPGECTLIKTQ